MAIPLIYNLRSVGKRWVSSIVAIAGIGGAVGVFIAMMAMARGFQATLVASGSVRNAMILRGGATSEMDSAIDRDQERTISDAPGIARDANGTPLVSAEVVCIASLPKKDTGTDANVQIRGVSPIVLQIRDVVKITEGRFFHPGVTELVVGRNVTLTIRGMNLGDKVKIGGREWDVVGVFDAGGSALDSEIWCDQPLLSQTFDRPENIFQSICARLQNPGTFQTVKDSLTSNPALTVDVMREVDFYTRQSQMITTVIHSLGFLVAIVMGIGAIFSALNTMYSAVSARAREVATLRALGFGGGSVVASFVLESLFISLIGGLVGALFALPVNGMTVSTINWQTFSHTAFAFQVTLPIVAMGIIFALFMGLVGGLMPAIRAARLPVAAALREL